MNHRAQLSVLDCRLRSKCKTGMTPVSADIQQRQNKEQIGYLRHQALKS